MPSGLTPYTWSEDEVITAAKLNALETRVVDGADASVTASEAAEAAANAVESGPITVSDVTASKTLALSDAGKLLRVTSSSSVTITVPAEASVNFDVGDLVVVARWGSGSVSIAGASGVTVESEDDLSSIYRRYGTVALVKVASDAWLLTGGLTSQ